MKSDKRKRPHRKAAAVVRLGIADFKCNACGAVVQRDLGWKTWTPSYCGGRDRAARLYRISAPSKPNSLTCAEAAIRFTVDPESGFVFDRENNEWLTTAEEVFDVLSPLLPNVTDQARGNRAGSNA